MASFTTSDGVSLHYKDEGEGTPLLCLAGLTRNATDFDFVAPHLDGTRLIRLDYRGRGKSKWADPATYTIPVEARDTLELLDHLRLEKVAILGTSRGGLIAMTLAALAHDRLLGVVLNDVGPELDPEGLEAIATYIGRNPSHRTHNDLLEIWPDVIVGFNNVPKSRFREEIARLYDETPEGLRITYDPKLRDAVLAAAEAPMPDLWPLFDALSGLPLCALRAENSNILPEATFAEMQRRRPDMIAAGVKDRGHVPYLDEPDSLAAIRQWMNLL
ncbi:alpha/beta hydrolase [Alisedimentitalea sp. MJ-SS2]|uniref:alpha/beta fold hydrolase n=1 Tax=Aliisedimentitalea sp. MJ-SS2 TaxID=3049795 RepID=UPI00290D4E3F|nr:alpha/beta hydrolase [Alisedimentitalea sp. MJ-SS2]MDU8925972.1 alpha/beta hydrolase [Alisedimentitalea sp. MJ-SS2]